MPTDRITPYEGLFLFPQSVAASLQAAVDHLKSLLERVDGQIISLRKWEERRLAYEIKGNKRGVYFLVYFKAPTSRLAELERSCNLSEQLLRVLITRADHLPMEQMEAADGQARLADEIRLRSESGAEDRPAPTAVATAEAEGEQTAEGEAEKPGGGDTGDSE